jgi:hypothetical protein
LRVILGNPAQEKAKSHKAPAGRQRDCPLQEHDAPAENLAYLHYVKSLKQKLSPAGHTVVKSRQCSSKPERIWRVVICRDDVVDVGGIDLAPRGINLREIVLPARQVIGSGRVHRWTPHYPTPLYEIENFGKNKLRASCSRGRTCYLPARRSYSAIEKFDPIERGRGAEGFFATLSKRRLKRGIFRSVVDLQAAINRFLDDHNAHCRPFQWVADPNKIIAAVRRGHQVSDHSG